MIYGIIHNNRPLITIVVAWNSGVQEIVALVDTGFTGELKIPPEKVSELGLKVTHTEDISLGDERIIQMPASIAVVSMEGISNTVNVLIGDGLPIIGVGLLKRFKYRMDVDFKNDTLELKVQK